MFCQNVIFEIEALVSQAFDASRGNVIECDAQEDYVRLSVVSINGGIIATLSAVDGLPFLFRVIRDGVRNDPAWPIIERIAAIAKASHQSTRTRTKKATETLTAKECVV